MSNHQEVDVEDDVREVSVPDAGVMQAISKAELDQRITTARAYPRDVRRFRRECLELATLTEQVAEECMYSLPRMEKGKPKPIEGPSARLAEIVASCWGNCDAGARVVDEGPEFVTAQGIFRDLQRNVSISYEVRRRITNKSGNRFSADMIGVTANAACSIALRNAVFKGVPKAFWADIYDAARQCAIGNAETLTGRRSKALAYLQKMGATEAQVLAVVGKTAVEEIGLDELAILKGLATAIKDGDTTVDQAFAEKPADGAGAKNLNEAVGAKPDAAASAHESLARETMALQKAHGWDQEDGAFHQEVVGIAPPKRLSDMTAAELQRFADYVRKWKPPTEGHKNPDLPPSV